MQNHRKRERVHFTTEVTLILGKIKKKFSKTRNVSMNGLFIETDEIVPPGNEGEMELLLIFGSSKKVIKSKFKVARSDALEEDSDGKPLPQGFGIILSDFEGESGEELYNVVRYNRQTSGT